MTLSDSDECTVFDELHCKRIVLLIAYTFVYMCVYTHIYVCEYTFMTMSLYNKPLTLLFLQHRSSCTTIKLCGWNFYNGIETTIYIKTCIL